MKILKTNTAIRIAVGPFLDCTDGVTPETGLTVTNTTCEMYQEDDDGTGVNRTALTLSSSGGNNDMVHITNDVAGYYDLELTDSNLNFLGRMTLVFTDADVHLPVFHEFLVVPADVFNMFYVNGLNEIADAVLKRNFASISGESARSALNALRFLRNKWSIAGTTLTVTKENDSTSAWTSEISTDAGANPVTGSDPT